jgi:hypothetical protein
MVFTIAELLNYWNAIGVFSYVLPFLLVFAIVYALLGKTKMFGEGGNKAIHTIIGIAVGLLSLQFEIVPIFFAIIFPKLGVFLAVILATLLLFGFTGLNNENARWVKWIGAIAAGIVVFWTFDEVSYLGGAGGGGFLWLLYSELFWSLIVLLLVVLLVYWVSQESK